MKKLLPLLVLLLLLSVSAHSQIHLFLEEQEITLSDARSSAWVFPVARDLDEALDDLKDYVRDRSDVRMKNEGENLIMAEKVSIPTIATKRGDLVGYGFITENYYGLALVFQLGYDISINSREWSTEMNNFRNYTKEFMSYHYEQSYARRIDALEKEVKSVEKERSQNEGKINSMNKKISNLVGRNAKEDDEAKITSNKAEITTLESDIQELTDTLPGLTSQIDVLNGNLNKLKTESHTYQTVIGSI